MNFTPGIIGFMQGRLTPMVDGKIQAFPAKHWREEFPIAEACGFRLMEWTLDQDGIFENPMLTKAGQLAILTLCKEHRLEIPSVTGDCFMQAPFWKNFEADREDLLSLFESIIVAAKAIGSSIIVVPLVDHGTIENDEEYRSLKDGCSRLKPTLEKFGIRIAFESDFPPMRLKRFIDAFDPCYFGINLDTGNSAALGWDPAEEISLYGERIINVHVKDRLLGGATVPLGTGAARLADTIRLIKNLPYRGNFILQTARAQDENHARDACLYRDMVSNWLAG
jgi:hexulose-6-phosphate isomerase